ncbi:NAD(P)-binding domain-containing protein [Streptomyces sp. NA04227]|uniref:NAD(P)-binding domain-containing protein n=1 Tax=Streptomyces sp. NA04227 TaxID=2742136 RepID=UPI001590118A|nr:NAD(P)-binding domain-containing protein [Streptomyces sp. NA04227]QKW10893.1 NAD(P)-binding domain-containing protein [Streptomyces sp. NA04227]
MHDLLVVGAGPYGLSVAAHAAAAGLDLRVFGRPMASWRDHMPAGMFLKSEPWASHLSDPVGRYGLDAFLAERGTGPGQQGTVDAQQPLPVRDFASYGIWFAERAVPPVDERRVESVAPCPDGGFEAVIRGGERVHARTVVLAVGTAPFVEIPPALRLLGDDGSRVSHSSHHSDLGRFRHQDVTVVGAGQSALETAALLAEQGTRVRLLARTAHLDWNALPPAPDRPWWRRARAPLSGLGTGWRTWAYAELPALFRRLPEDSRIRIGREALGPAGAWWLRERVETAVEVRPGQEIVRVRHEPGGAVGLDICGPAGRLTALRTDHVIAATGYEVTASRLSPLDPAARSSLTCFCDGSPAVGPDFESSLPGLFLAGLVTTSAFGPAMRFVHGTSYTARRLLQGVQRRLHHQDAAPEFAPGPMTTAAPTATSTSTSTSTAVVRRSASGGPVHVREASG